MKMLVHKPALPLSKFVDCIWYFSGSRATRELALPTGTIELVINLEKDHGRIFAGVDDRIGQAFTGAMICGPHSRYFVLDAAVRSSVVGVHFRPGGAAPFLGMPLGKLRDIHVDLDGIWGPSAHHLRDELQGLSSPFLVFRRLEQALIQRYREKSRYHPAVAFALEQFQAAPTVARVKEIAKSTRYSDKRFIRLFTDGIGLTPKRFCRIQRLQAVLDHLADGRAVEWARFAVANGYCDQSLLIRDFRQMTGLTPAEYVPVSPSSPNHVAIR